MRRINYYFLFFCCLLLWQFTAIAGANPEFTTETPVNCVDNNTKDLVKSNSSEEVVTCEGTQLAYWSLDACLSNSTGTSKFDFSEFTAATTTPAGFSIVNASILSNNSGVHSCTAGESGAAICSGTRTACNFVDNSDEAFTFSITVRPTNGGTAELTKLSFYEAAPQQFLHLSGNSGDNDPPSQYGVRVLKNGQEIYQRTGRNTTENWTYEQFNLSNDPDFSFSGQTTFEFELLGYCRQGSGGLAAWDLDEIKIFGCANTPIDPCANAGGDSDGDGICNNDDCQPNNPNFPATPGSSCNDGNSNTTNDMVTADGCGCAGTPVGPACSVSTNGCNIRITGLNNSDYAKVFDANWNIIFDCNPWANSGCNSTETITVPSNGTYHVQACGQTQTVTISGCTQAGPCDNAGGDSDGDGVCNNDDCQPNNPNYPATPGSSCNDGNPNTTNDMVTADGCGCAGTPVGPACSVSTNGCNIRITGLNNSDYAKVFDANWNIIFDCNPWANGGCNSTETITVPSNGTYHVQACGQTQTVTISGCTQAGPCDNAGGDSDGDGVCNNDDCQPNNPNFPATPGSSCNDGNPNTTNDMVTADGCGCAGTQVQVCNPTRLAYWSLDACESFPGDGSANDFSEFTAETNTPAGFSVVNASILTHDDGVHSCTQGQSGIAICSGTRTACTWSDNSDDAFKFSITVRPTNGETATLTKLSFYEAAPHQFLHISGNSGDNDPPSRYGMRVLKNGQEIYQRTGRNTTENWTYEEFDLADDADFQFSSQTTFEFELLGYCRQGSGGLAAWDLDEIKVFGCAGTPGSTASITQQSDYLYFDAVKSDRGVSMNWVTNSDYKNEYFEVEYSRDGINFELLEEVMSISDSRDYMNYQSRDEHASEGINYYRVKQIYADGSYRYSEVKEVSFDLNLKDFTVYPNPALDQINLSLGAYEGLSAEIMISNSLGQPMQSRSIDALTDEVVRFDMPNYQPGVYTVRIKLDGKRQMTKMFVISRL